jgi:micrococcal nuclease
MTFRSCIQIALVLAGVLLNPVAASAQLVQRVIDGDTVAVQGIGTVRLIGVDAPETSQESGAFLRGLTINKVVRLEYDGQKTDSYGRTLAYLHLAGGTFVNAEIVKQGYAHAYTEFPFRYLEQFRAYEREAQAAARGLWASSSALSVAPPAAQPGATTTVYVTRTGEKYHRAGCRSLARSQIPMQLADAAARYGPCAICKPPTLASTPSTPAAVAPPSRPSSSGRCQAITKRGTQCSRIAQAGRNYCWQH